MNPEDYLHAVRDRLATDNNITGYEITREQFTPLNAQIRVRLTLSDNSKLEFSEFLRLNNRGEIDIVAYSYHWMDTSNELRIRWDNAEHYPNLPGFPHHLHDGDEKNVVSGEPMNLFKVLDLIAERLEK